MSAATEAGTPIPADALMAAHGGWRKPDGPAAAAHASERHDA